MTEEKRCPYCQSPLEPAFALMLRYFHESRTLLIDVYKTAFEGAVAVIHRDDAEYNRLYKILHEKVQQCSAIIEKYLSAKEEIQSKVA